MLAVLLLAIGRLLSIAGSLCFVLAQLHLDAVCAALRGLGCSAPPSSTGGLLLPWQQPAAGAECGAPPYPVSARACVDNERGSRPGELAHGQHDVNHPPRKRPRTEARCPPLRLNIEHQQQQQQQQQQHGGDGDATSRDMQLSLSRRAHSQRMSAASDDVHLSSTRRTARGGYGNSSSSYGGGTPATAAAAAAAAATAAAVAFFTRGVRCEQQQERFDKQQQQHGGEQDSTAQRLGGPHVLLPLPSSTQQLWRQQQQQQQQRQQELDGQGTTTVAAAAAGAAALLASRLCSSISIGQHKHQRPPPPAPTPRINSSSVTSTSVPPLELDATTEERQELEAAAPPEFLCPLGRMLMTDPVCTPRGITYQRSCLEAHLCRLRMRGAAAATGGVGAAGPAGPNTSAAALTAALYPNIVLRDQIASWLQQRGVVT